MHSVLDTYHEDDDLFAAVIAPQPPLEVQLAQLDIGGSELNEASDKAGATLYDGSEEFLSQTLKSLKKVTFRDQQPQALTSHPHKETWNRQKDRLHGS